jgi:hypothetical protein
MDNGKSAIEDGFGRTKMLMLVLMVLLMLMLTLTCMWILLMWIPRSILMNHNEMLILMLALEKSSGDVGVMNA